MFVIVVNDKGKLTLYLAVNESHAINLCDSFEKYGYEAIYYAALDLWEMNQ